MPDHTATPTALANGQLPLHEWVTPEGFAACHLELSEFPLPLVCLALSAMHPGTPAAIATTDRLPGLVWLPTPTHAIVVHVTGYQPQHGTVVLPRPLGGSWSSDWPVPVTDAAHVAETCRRLLQDGYVSLLAGDHRDVALTAIAALGYRHGHDAAAWWEQDTIGARASGDTRAVARAVLKGIDDGDPAVLDSLPATAPSTTDSDGSGGGDERLWQDLQDAYRFGFTDGSTDCIRAACQAVLS